MENQWTRTEMLLGKDGIKKLRDSRVAVFGVGGVGGFAVEALARAGVGTIDLFDRDDVSVSNINRQIIALQNTVGLAKVDVMKERIALIDPDIVVNSHKIFYLPQTADEIDLSVYDYVVDAVDTVSAKIELAVRCRDKNIRIISAMGAGNKLDPTRFEVADISKTSVCPLARVMRRELKNRGISHLKVVYSNEEPIKYSHVDDGNTSKKSPGSLSFVPSVAGLIVAGEVIKDLCQK